MFELQVVGAIIVGVAVVYGVSYAVGRAFAAGFFNRKRQYNREVLEDLERKEKPE